MVMDPLGLHLNSVPGTAYVYGRDELNHQKIYTN